MSRKKFIESLGATCSNWTWSWSFVNHKERLVIFGAWDTYTKGNKVLILNEDWVQSDDGRKLPGYPQAREHIGLVERAGYVLTTFPIRYSDKHKDERGHGPSKIGDFDPQLTLKTVKRIGRKWYAVDLSATAAPLVDDTVDDIPGVDYSTFGSDGAIRHIVKRSYVKRDPRVRRKVIERAIRGCERMSCEDTRRYSGFLDVHHILGVETSDRYWNCVALCPSCHRAAHFAPDRDKINRELLDFASQFKG